MGAAILVIAGFLALIVVESVIRGYVLSILWAWFAVPFGLPAIGVAWAIGIALLIGMIAKDGNTKDHKAEDLPGLIIGALIAPFFVLLVGWIVKGFM